MTLLGWLLSETSANSDLKGLIHYERSALWRSNLFLNVRTKIANSDLSIRSTSMDLASLFMV
jgi:hypothetical protein